MVEWLDGRGVVLRRPGIGVATVSRVGQEDSRYAVLGEHAFDSERRRMSVVVRRAGRERTVKGSSDADVHAELLMKGADEAVLPLAVDAGESGRSSMSRQAASDAVLRFARMGLRTLVLARRQLSITNAGGRSCTHELQTLPTRRRHRVCKTAERAATGAGAEIVGVRVSRMSYNAERRPYVASAAGARVDAYGDKVETAVAVAKTAALLDADDECSASEPTRLESFSTSRRHGRRAAARAGEAVVIAGHVLAQIISDEHGEDALAAAVERCPTAVVCRASPLQKAAVASIARGAAAAVSCTCLAIGDGANDVGMLRVAHVGVGIAGAEGRRAAMSADIALGAFRSLCWCTAIGRTRVWPTWRFTSSIAVQSSSLCFSSILSTQTTRPCPASTSGTSYFIRSSTPLCRPSWSPLRTRMCLGTRCWLSRHCTRWAAIARSIHTSSSCSCWSTRFGRPRPSFS